MITNNNTGSNDEERLLISRAAELSARSENRAVASSFLTPREQMLVSNWARLSGASDRVMLWGGCFGCERRKAIFLPGWIETDAPCGGSVFSGAQEEHFIALLDSFGSADMTDEFVRPVRLRGSGYRELSHRDWLGALMSMGIKRETVGDIAVMSSSEAIAFFDPVAADYICGELKKAGSDTVLATAADIGRDFRVKRNLEPVSATVASPRADGVVRALCGVSRDGAVQLISSGQVEINYFTEENADRHVAAGDILSVRGYGKFVIKKAEDVTRKGRIRLEAEKYI